MWICFSFLLPLRVWSKICNVKTFSTIFEHTPNQSILKNFSKVEEWLKIQKKQKLKQENYKWILIEHIIIALSIVELLFAKWPQLLLLLFLLLLEEETFELSGSCSNTQFENSNLNMKAHFLNKITIIHKQNDVCISIISTKISSSLYINI